MTNFNPEKTISATASGIIISYGDVKKHQYVSYESSYVKEIQLHGTTRYQQNNNVTFTPTQENLYLKALHGLDAYDKKELKSITKESFDKIKATYSRVQWILKKWKQELIANSVDDLLLSIFPRSAVIKDFVSATGYHDDIPKKDQMSFKELGITMSMIADKLIECNILPQNFYQLK